MKIQDTRLVFTNTFSGYKKTNAYKEFINSMYYQKQEDAYFWTGELLCSNCIVELWDGYIDFMCKYIQLLH